MNKRDWIPRDKCLICGSDLTYLPVGKVYYSKQILMVGPALDYNNPELEVVYGLCPNHAGQAVTNEEIYSVIYKYMRKHIEELENQIVDDIILNKKEK